MKPVLIILLASLVAVALSQSIVVNYGCKSYSKDGTKCLLCSDRFYMDQSGICQPVSSNCKTYNSTNGACLSCYGGYFLADVICVFGTLPSSSSATYDPYCLNVTNGACSQCSKGFYLLNSTCTAVNPLCKTFDYAKLACIGCYNGYQLNSNGDCSVPAANPADVGCSQFNNSVCVKCSVGYYFNSNKNCAQANSLCKSYDQTNGSCLSCYAGFKLSQGNCNVDDSSNLNPFCQKFQNSTCTTCSFGYYFDSNKICQQIDPLCKHFNYSSAVCSSCYMGFELVNGICSVSNSSVSSDSNCKIFGANNVCLNCSSGFYFNKNNICTQVNPNCKTFDFVNLVCTACYIGYDLVADQCNPTNASSTTSATCAEWLNSVCTKCVPRAYYNFEGNCVMVSDLCQAFNFIGQCTSCYSGYALDSGNCVASNSSNLCASTDQKTGLCVKCYNGSYLSAASQCEPIDPYCSTFNYQTYQCDACYKGYSVTKGKCQQAVAITTSIPNCVEYDSNQNCLKCYNLYYLSSNSCIEVNPLCKTYDSSNGNCLSCFSIFTLKNGNCVIN